MLTQPLSNGCSRLIAKGLTHRHNGATATETKTALRRRRALWLIPAAAFALCFASAHSTSAQSAEPIQSVIPVNIDATSGNITVGGTVYPGGNPGMNIVALKRQSVQASPGVIFPISNQTFTDASSANQFLQNVLAGNPDAILILNAVGNYGFGLTAMADSLHQFGAAHDIDAISTAIQFVFIGNGGLHTGQAHQSGDSSRNTTGYFATDSNSNYTFIQPDYVKFDILLDGTIKIGGTTYTVAGSGKVSGCNGSNAFHVVAAQRDAPGVLIGNESYCTAQSDSEITHILTDLSTLAGNESNLVFVASSGHPIPADWNFGTDGDSRIYPLAQVVARLGGYWETMVYLTPTDTYSLVGAAVPPAGTPGARKRARESSSVYPDHPTGELHGVLARGLRGNWYSPLSIDLSGKANLGFYEILAQQPVPFPHPANQDELNAFNYIGTQLGVSGNLRNSYPNNIDNWLSTLIAMKDAQNDDCSDPKNAAIPFCIVQQQLLTEFKYVGDISTFQGQLTNLYQGSGTDTILDMLSTYNNIEANLPAPPAAPAPSLVGPIVNLFLGLASAIPEIGPAFGLADTAFNFATSLTTDVSGNKTINLSSTVASLQQDAVKHFNAGLTTTGTQFDFIYQDWGKISTLGAALAQAQRGSPWFWDPDTTTGQILQAMAPAIEQSYYQSLMAALFAIGRYVPTSWGGTPIWEQPQTYVSDNQELQGTSNISAQVFNYPWYPPYTFPSDLNNPIEVPSNPAYTQATATLLAADAWLGIGSQTDPPSGGPNGLYQPPASSILSTLFSPQSEGGLGVYRPAFFEGWPFPRVTCDASTPDGSDPGGGCDFGSAAPPPEALPEPITSISIKPGKIVRNGTRLDVPLRITNNGTRESTSTEIREISLRTVSGHGKALLVDPALPIHIGRLLPGTFIKITLTLNVPPPVTELELTENGTVDNGDSTPYQFSLAQVILPPEKGK